MACDCGRILGDRFGDLMLALLFDPIVSPRMSLLMALKLLEALSEKPPTSNASVAPDL